MNKFDEEILMLENKFLKGAALAGLVAGSSMQGANATPRQQQHQSVRQEGVSADVLGTVRRDILQDEGWVDSKYQDSVDVPTVGYGFNLQEPHIQNSIRNAGLDLDGIMAGTTPMSKPDANKVLQLGIETAVKDAIQYFPELTQLPPDKQAVIINMSYNLGLSKLNKFVDMRAALYNRDYKRAGLEMEDSKWWDQVGERARKLRVRMEAGA